MTSTTPTEPRVPRILVVDDMPDNLFLMNGLLEDRFEVVQATCGAEALKIVMSDRPPDMVLLDIMMPDMDGYEVLRRIRQHPPTANIPVIFLTALASKQDERLGLQLGALDYLTKPVDPQLVVQRVEAHARATANGRRLEALSEKLARHLSPASWQRLFGGPQPGASVRFEQKVQTVLHAEASDFSRWNEREHDRFLAEVEWLAARHHGTVDRYVDGGAAVFFDEPHGCVRMAMDLHRSARDRSLRLGIHTGLCEIATFQGDQPGCCTLVGDEIALAAEVARTAALGSVAVSPETYALVKDDLFKTAGGCLLTEEFQDSDLAQVCLTPAPAPDSGRSTFAGLGRM